VQIDGIREGIRFDKVSFSYGREPVLRDVSLDVRAGEVVALVGRTGSGKTTLADLLLRFYEPIAGSIEIDGLDLRRIARGSLLEHVAVVSQEPFLFGGTIKDNIQYGRPDASEAEIIAAARASYVDEFVSGLPQGYDTPVGDAGTKLSGGQRQRITIARALLKNPALLIFDEATSSLDAKSEQLVQRAIDALLQDRTVLVIAHRLSTIRHADKIVVLEEGAVSQLGTHDELMEKPGLYRELVRIQTGGNA
jgi:ABC-type multidrug transport system fused ATPase/permease subunit